MVEEIDIIGFLYADYYPNNGMTYEKFRRMKYKFMKGLNRHSPKQTINDDAVDEFFKVVEEMGTTETAIVDWGGGGWNSEKTFRHSNVDRKSSYFDTCLRPYNVLFGKPNFHFAGICQHCSSIILPRSKRNRNDVAIKNRRGDLTGVLDMENPFVKILVDHIGSRGHWAIANSLSNESLGEIIADNAKGNLYTVVTTYLDKGGNALPKLIKKSNGLFFSVKEFYGMYGKEVMNDWAEKVDKGLKPTDIKKIADNVKEFAQEGVTNGYCLGGGLEGFVCVTLGEYGAVMYDPFNQGVFWTRLGEKPWQGVQKYIGDTGRKTNTSGDTLAAVHVDRQKRGDGLEDSLKTASAHVVNTVLNCDGISKEDYVSEYMN